MQLNKERHLFDHKLAMSPRITYRDPFSKALKSVSEAWHLPHHIMSVLLRFFLLHRWPKPIPESLISAFFLQAVGMPPVTHSSPFSAAPGAGVKVGHLQPWYVVSIFAPCQLLYVYQEPFNRYSWHGSSILFRFFCPCLDSRRWAEASVLPSHPVSRAQSRGWICRSALSGSWGALRRLLPETQAHLLTGTRQLPLNHQLSKGSLLKYHL